MKLATTIIAAIFGTAVSTIAQPANDNFADRISLTGYTNVVPISSTLATAETGEPSKAESLGYGTVWFSWTAPATGTTTIYYSGDAFYRTFGVFTGTQLTKLHRVVSPNTGITFEVKAGQVFQIQAMATPTLPDYFMHVELAARPANDNFTNRSVLEGTLISTNGDNSAATRERGEPRHNGVNFGRSLWYSWTAPAADGFLLT